MLTSIPKQFSGTLIQNTRTSIGIPRKDKNINNSVVFDRKLTKLIYSSSQRPRLSLQANSFFWCSNFAFGNIFITENSIIFTVEYCRLHSALREIYAVILKYLKKTKDMSRSTHKVK